MTKHSQSEGEIGTVQVALDTSGAVLSLLCAAHCLLLPLLISLLPALGLQVLKQHWVHLLLLGLVLPVVIVAFWRGVKRHGNTKVLWFGGLGIALLVSAVIWGDALGLESAMTLAGSLCLVAAHVINLFACRAECRCDTTSQEAASAG